MDDQVWTDFQNSSKLPCVTLCTREVITITAEGRIGPVCEHLDAFERYCKKF